ncbi:MAG: endospore germination permease [Bacillota bacterium]|nr:endospore germination permease [Bacillota bacterium]
MEKEFITDKEAICLFIVFVIGSSLVISGGGAKNDSWIAVIIGVAMAIPLMVIYARMISLFPGQNLYDISVTVFGKIGGSIITIIYIIYAFHLGALVLRNFGEFIKIVAMPETPMLFSLFSMGMISIIAARLGIEVMARTSTFFLPIVFAILSIVQLLAIPQFHMEYLKPILGNGIHPVLNGGFAIFSFPFCETVLFICLFSSLKSKKSSFRVYKFGILITTFLFIIVTIRNIGVLGNTLDSYYFPSYEAVRRIKIGDFLQRMEVTVSFVLFIGVLFKSSVCLLAAAKGVSKLFKLNDYRSVVIQIGLMMIYFAYIIYDNSMQMKYWALKIYPYYAFPVQVIIPVILWIFAEVKVRKSSS